jgi:tRNA(Arg) A34 adenosine deaminase TadA
LRVDLGRFEERARRVFERERLGDNDFRVVAFALDNKGRVLSEGWNSYTKSHPIQQRASQSSNPHKRFLHAEIHALSKIGRKHLGRQHTILVYRFDADKGLKPGKPCPICSQVIEQYGIENVIHS